MSNLWEETISVLKKYHKTWKDVRFVCGDNFGVTNFKTLAKRTNYDEGFGGQEVATDIKVVGDYWWLERHEYDGSEWWEYKEMPVKPKEFFAMNNLLAEIGWDTLAEIKDKEQEHGDPEER